MFATGPTRRSGGLRPELPEAALLASARGRAANGFASPTLAARAPAPPAGRCAASLARETRGFADSQRRALRAARYALGAGDRDNDRALRTARDAGSRTLREATGRPGSMASCRRCILLCGGLFEGQGCQAAGDRRQAFAVLFDVVGRA